jgi:hypothetical protein
LLLAAVILVVAGCGGETPETAQAPAEPAAAAAPAMRLPVAVDTRTLMVDVIAPATNPIWELSYKEMITDEEWTRIGQSAATVAVAMSATAQGASDDNGRSNDPRWLDWSKRVTELVLQAKTAADNKDQMALQMAGDALVDACAICHSYYVAGAAPPPPGQ